ncbi:MAG TPA: aminoglycoside phosphotransferase family protein [Tissierellaceae bacterium]|nr:aminoglycoside phosphotransferase family protein [Tissierellaceae bacterium]
MDLGKIRKDKDFIEIFGLIDPDGFQPLGQGEYNINYIFNSKVTGEKLVLRIATDSQMHLENQIGYEFKALELLANSGRTPRPFYCDSRKTLIPYGFLVMEFLPGVPLNYKRDLKLAAQALSEVHSLVIPKDNHLLLPEDPIGAIYEECKMMFDEYSSSAHMEVSVRYKIDSLLDMVEGMEAEDIGNRVMINTEINSGNFLINGTDKPNYLIDWEKPLYGYPAQDLGHFLAPTTTSWKTDTILSKDEMLLFISDYCRMSKGGYVVSELWNSVRRYVSMNCLRGITWCSMAYSLYQDPDKLITNDYTYRKIKTYLSEDFLDMIRKEYLGDI